MVHRDMCAREWACDVRWVMITWPVILRGAEQLSDLVRQDGAQERGKQERRKTARVRKLTLSYVTFSSMCLRVVADVCGALVRERGGQHANLI